MLGEGVEVLAGAALRPEHHEQVAGRDAVRGPEVQRVVQPDQHHERLVQRVEVGVRDRHAVPDRGGHQFLPIEEGLLDGRGVGGGEVAGLHGPADGRPEHLRQVPRPQVGQHQVLGQGGAERLHGRPGEGRERAVRNGKCRTAARGA